MDLIRKYFPEFSPGQLAQFENLGQLYPEWNQKINLISRKDMNHLYERHILHSLGIYKFIQFRKDTKILDVGTGGGFPGIPLAIANPEANFTLLDSIAKKIMVVQDIIEKCQLQNVKATISRVEKYPGEFHYIVSRAVTNFPGFYQLVKNKMIRSSHQSMSNGILYLKGGDFSNELKSFSNKIKIIDLNNYFREEFFSSKKIIYLIVK